MGDGDTTELTLESMAETAYEMHCNLTGDQTSPGWEGLTVAQRETWRRIVDWCRHPDE